MFAAFKAFLESVSAIAIISGIGVYFFLDHRETDRSKIERSISFATLLQSTEARAASYDLFKPFRDLNVDLQDEVIPEEVAEKLVQDVVAATEGLYEAVYETTSFYDTLQLCIDNKACHLETAQGLLGESAHEFYCLYSPIIREMPKGSRVYLGEGLREFATSERACGEDPAPLAENNPPNLLPFLSN